ncbi:hypothetical protein AVEN_275683-1 [Araneus ventricosus]|uniref:Uncharacterized protein n=1 Tax=Araneus ventricosus TaxID=182803 RepID=A0A4Y2VE92_ARAVE|nr:hypothetical protein AVEN_275683-1 [Araneus ventricosus]
MFFKYHRLKKSTLIRQVRSSMPDERALSGNDDIPPAAGLHPHPPSALLADAANVGLCGMWGFRDFHRSTWLDTILSWQQPSGCYKDRAKWHCIGEIRMILELT